MGYGDISPITPLGQLLASFLMIMGYGIIAVPTGIVSAEYVKSETYVHTNSQVCRNCGTSKHRDDAKFCHKCGRTLFEEEVEEETSV